MDSVKQEERKKRLIAFAEVLKRKRKETGLSQSEFGEMIGVSRITVNNWEHHTKGIGGDYMIKLADALGTDADTLNNEIIIEMNRNNSITLLDDMAATDSGSYERFKEYLTRLSEFESKLESQPTGPDPEEDKKTGAEVDAEYEKHSKSQSSPDRESQDDEESKLQYMERRLLIANYEKLNLSARADVMKYIAELQKDENNLKEK